MATVRIILDPHESEADARELLVKALTHHEDGAQHKQTFLQPAARDVYEKMMVEHEAMFSKMLKEINQVIDEEVE
jgi:hypothetical protein